MILEAIAHRGLHDRVPENTLDAFRAAVEAGADGVELDVHATSDGTVVVHHDPVVAGRPEDPRFRGVPIAELSFDEVQQFDLGAGARVPTLAATLAILRGSLTAYVEIKGSGIEALVADGIALSGAACAVHSFDHRAVARLARIAPGIERGVLEQAAPADPVAVLQAADARDLWQHTRSITARLVEAVHAAGGRVIAWTANDMREWERLAAAGVDGICTDELRSFVAWRAARRE